MAVADRMVQLRYSLPYKRRGRLRTLTVNGSLQEVNHLESEFSNKTECLWILPPISRKDRTAMRNKGQSLAAALGRVGAEISVACG